MPHAILEQADSGWSVTFRHIPYDASALAAMAAEARMADWASALLTGRVSQPGQRDL